MSVARLRFARSLSQCSLGIVPRSSVPERLCLTNTVFEEKFVPNTINEFKKKIAVLVPESRTQIDVLSLRVMNIESPQLKQLNPRNEERRE